MTSRRSGRARRAVAALGFVAALVVPLAIAACQPRSGVDGARAFARVERQVHMGPRIPGTPGHDSARVWIESELAKLGAQVDAQRFEDSTLGRPLELTNIVGRYGPDLGRRVALVAHWDSRPWCDEDPDTSKRAQPLAGANDGASGVAVLLEVAELLAHQAPKIGVDLVFVDGEDLGTHSDPAGYCRGSRDFARRVREGRTPAIAAAFIFDMVGDKDLEIHPEVRSAHDASNLAQLVYDGAQATGARHFRPDPEWELFDDHYPFLDAGIPAVDIIDFDYPAWHTSRDLPDQVSGASLAEVAGVAAWIVYRSPLARPAP